MQKIALSADGETCLFLFSFIPKLTWEEEIVKRGGKKREKARKPPKVITV